MLFIICFWLHLSCLFLFVSLSYSPFLVLFCLFILDCLVIVLISICFIVWFPLLCFMLSICYVCVSWFSSYWFHCAISLSLLVSCLFLFYVCMYCVNGYLFHCVTFPYLFVLFGSICFAFVFLVFSCYLFHCVIRPSFFVLVCLLLFMFVLLVLVVVCFIVWVPLLCLPSFVYYALFVDLLL